MKNKLITLIVVLLICIFAFYIRTYNVNWDSGTHLQPDERFLTMVTNDMRIPQTFGDYLDPQVSTMNPRNINYPFYVYGTFPLYLVKTIAIVVKMDNYNDITIVGRYASAVFDTSIVLILFFLSKLLLSSKSKIQSSKQFRNSEVKNANILVQLFGNLKLELGNLGDDLSSSPRGI